MRDNRARFAAVVVAGTLSHDRRLGVAKEWMEGRGRQRSRKKGERI
jgi:hypothetical protein